MADSIANTRLFAIAQPIDKASFLELYREVSLLAKLVFAPFGLSSHLSTITEPEAFLQTHTTVYQQVEDVLSKCLFRHHSLADDQVVATMHEFVGKTQDESVMKEIKPVTESLSILFSPNPVVEFAFDDEQSLSWSTFFSSATAHACHDKIRTALMSLRQLAFALTTASAGTAVRSSDDLSATHGKTSSYSDAIADRDERIQKTFGIDISRRLSSPILDMFALTTSHSEDIETELSSILAQLLDALVVTVPRVHLPSLDAVESTAQEVDTGEVVSVRLSYEQYIALLEQCHEDREALQSDRMNWFLHPSLSFVLQLNRLMAVHRVQLQQQQGEEDSTEATADDFDMELATRSYAFATRALLAIEQAAEKERAGEGEDAANLLSALLDQIDLSLFHATSCDDTHPSDADDPEEIVIPAALAVQLLIARAKAWLSVGDADSCLMDCDEVLLIDRQSAAAYSIRSELLLQGFPYLQQMPDEDIEPIRESCEHTLRSLWGNSAAPDATSEQESIREQATESELSLHQAAEDALLAFLLGGSNDIALAAVAEEAARETCRSHARNVFTAKHDQLSQLQPLVNDEIDLERLRRQHWPRAWLISAYLSSYETLSLALSLHGAPTEPDALVNQDSLTGGDALASNEISSDMHDIDEGDHQDLIREAQRGKSQLPPRHLLFTRSPPGATEESLVSRCEYDCEAYALLCELCSELELCLSPSGLKTVNPSDKDEDEAKVKPAEVSTKANTGLTTVSVQNIAVSREQLLAETAIELIDAHAYLTSFGRCTALDSPTTSEDVQPSSSPSETQSLIVWQDDNNTSWEVAPSVRFARCVTWLQAQSHLTGVKMSPLGRVTSIDVEYVKKTYKPVIPKDKKASANSKKSKKDRDEETQGMDFEDFARHFGAHGFFGGGDYPIHEENDDEDDDDDDDEDDHSHGDDEDEPHKHGAGSEDEESVWEDVDDDEDEDEDEDDAEHASSLSREGKAAEAEAHEKEEEEAYLKHLNSCDRSTSELDQESHNVTESPRPEPVSRSDSSSPSPTLTLDDELLSGTEKPILPEPSTANDDDSEADAPPSASGETSDCDDQEAVVESHDVTSVVCANEELDQECHARSNDQRLAQESHTVSPKLRARLLSICGSIAYLTGDALGAVDCFEASLYFDPSIVDTKVKLAALLVDLDDDTKAQSLFAECLEESPTHPVVLLHHAECHIHLNDFDAATRALRQAQRILSYRQREFAQWTSTMPVAVHPYCQALLQDQQKTIQSRFATSSPTAINEPFWSLVFQSRIEEGLAHLASNVYALLGVCLFRDNPNRPEVALSLLEEGLRYFPKSVVLLLCSGEVHSQCGDMARSIKLFEEAAQESCSPAARSRHSIGAREAESGMAVRESTVEEDDWSHPLPFVNASRTYQQLGQLQAAERHVVRALAIDPSLAMTRVDAAQLWRQQQEIVRAAEALDEAMTLAKQVSEIRDVLTAKYVVLLQQSLKEKNLYSAPINL